MSRVVPEGVQYIIVKPMEYLISGLKIPKLLWFHVFNVQQKLTNFFYKLLNSKYIRLERQNISIAIT